MNTGEWAGRLGWYEGALTSTERFLILHYVESVHDPSLGGREYWDPEGVAHQEGFREGIRRGINIARPRTSRDLLAIADRWVRIKGIAHCLARVQRDREATAREVDRILAD